MTKRKLERVTEQQAMAEAEAMAEPDADELRAGISFWKNIHVPTLSPSLEGIELGLCLPGQTRAN